MGMAIARSIIIAVLLAAIGLVLGASSASPWSPRWAAPLIGLVSILLGSRSGEAA